jgi:5-methylcytosine-specific restriction protein A
MSKPYRLMSAVERAGRKGQVWESKRRATFARFGDVCWLCGRPGADTVDHVTPLSLGGTSDLDNLRPAHGAKTDYCEGNFGRGNRKPRPMLNTSREW